MIVFDGVEKKYGEDVIALANLSLKIEDGEFIFLVGPSGAGKTTLLRLLIREILPTKGSIFLNDWEINRLPDNKLPQLRRRLGFVFQDFKLLYDRTVAENIGVTLEILGKKREEISKRIDEMLRIVHLEGKENYFPVQLSYGERQRVSIARAIAGEAKILLAD